MLFITTLFVALSYRATLLTPVSAVSGSNTLLSFDIELVKKYIQSIENGNYKKGKIPELWDGKATERILKVISNNL